MIYNKAFYSNFSKYIDNIDYSSYTLQYPPPFIGENKFINNKFIFSFIGEKENLGLYVHIPFCETKCSFCRYYSIISNDGIVYLKYVNYLIKELKMYSKVLSENSLKINSLYFGGGTPSILDKNSLDKILGFIYSNFSFSKDFQFCFEANPSSLNFNKIKLLKKYNCDRLTIGVQSMDYLVLKSINRKQTKKDVFSAIYISKKLGIPYVNIDLMLGIKGQTLVSFIRDIKEIVYLKPDMIHLHPYTSTERVIDNLGFTSDEKIKKKMEILGNKIIKNNGYKDIEGDAYGLNDDSKNKQLYNAINLGKYIGVGVSSVGFNGKYRVINENNINTYFSLIDKGVFPVKFGTKLEKKDNMIQYIIYSMRYRSIFYNDFMEKFGENIFEVFKEEINSLRNIGKLKIMGNEIIFYFNTPLEYSIYSKYFYNKNILKELYNKINKINEKKY